MGEGTNEGLKRIWGTWEELILGGAVLRHGTHNWEVVASELRARTLYPYAYNSQTCKAKYEALRRRYSGFTFRAWFEELRKRRVAELKRELQKSDDIIGSLELKLQSLKEKKTNGDQIEYGCRTELPVPLQTTEGFELSCKETSKDGLSAGSFTQDISIPAMESPQEMKIKIELPDSCALERVLNMEKLMETSNETCRKRRGKRKRKDCNWEVKEGSIGESDNLGSTNFVSSRNETSTSGYGYGQTFPSSSVDIQDGDSYRTGNDDLVGIFNSIAETGNALVFKHRLDSQKRARYRKTIRQRMDFETLRSRIANCSITTAKELFRDLLLLANNALVFYSKRTREYKSALSLRDFITNRYRYYFKDSGSRASSSIPCFSPMYNPPVRPRSVRARPPNIILSAKLNGALPCPRGYLKLSNVNSTPKVPPPVVMSKRIDGVNPQRFDRLCDDLGTQSMVNARLCDDLGTQSMVKAKKSIVLSQGYKKIRSSDPNHLVQSPLIVKKGVGRPRKAGGGPKGNRRSKAPINKERKQGCEE